jgi:hypothetical protein
MGVLVVRRRRTEVELGGGAGEGGREGGRGVSGGGGGGCGGEGSGERGVSVMGEGVGPSLMPSGLVHVLPLTMLPSRGGRARDGRR